MARKSKTKKLLKRARKAASPARVALIGALGGAVMAYLNRDRVKAEIDNFRAQSGSHAAAAE